MSTKRRELRRMIAIGVAVVFAVIAWRLLLKGVEPKIHGRKISQKIDVQLAKSGKWTLFFRGCETCDVASPEAIAKATEIYALLLENRGSAQWQDMTSLKGAEWTDFWEKLASEISDPIENTFFIADPSGRVIASYSSSVPVEKISADIRHMILVD